MVGTVVLPVTPEDVEPVLDISPPPVVIAVIEPVVPDVVTVLGPVVVNEVTLVIGVLDTAEVVSSGPNVSTVSPSSVVV